MEGTTKAFLAGTVSFCVSGIFPDIDVFPALVL